MEDDLLFEVVAKGVQVDGGDQLAELTALQTDALHPGRRTGASYIATLTGMITYV